MQHQDLERLIRLSKKTGDTLIIGDPKGGESVVLLPLDKYEALIDAWTGEDGYLVEEEQEEAPYDPRLYEEPEADIPELPLEEIRKIASEERREEVEVEDEEEEQGQSEASDDLDVLEEERFYLEPIE